MTPYEVFFFSSGAVEEHWTVKDLGTSRLNVLVGFPLGGLLSVAIAAGATLRPAARPDRGDLAVAGRHAGRCRRRQTRPGVRRRSASSPPPSAPHWRPRCPPAIPLAQFFGWAWGKFRNPAEAARFHTVMLVVVIACAAVLFTGVDPILVTEYSVVFSAIALPLTYLPILIVANDPGYMGEHVNGRATNVLASLYLVLILAASLAAIPLMIVTGAGQ